MPIQIFPPIQGKTAPRYQSQIIMIYLKKSRLSIFNLRMGLLNFVGRGDFTGRHTQSMEAFSTMQSLTPMIRGTNIYHKWAGIAAKMFSMYISLAQQTVIPVIPLTYMNNGGIIGYNKLRRCYFGAV